jgi:putative drug exporter of the RND superfamily
VSTVLAAIGRFSVRFRWLIVVAWVAATYAAVAFLPSLSSVTQSDNTSFLPSSAPSVQAEKLAASFGSANLTRIFVVAARPGTPLTASDSAALTALQGRLRTASGVTQVRDLGKSADGQADELVVLADGNANTTTLASALRADITAAHLPAGLQAHLAGQTAAQADSSAQSNGVAKKLENFSVVFVILLLMVVFRAMLAPVLTIVPAILAVTIAGPLTAEAAHAGLKVSSMAQLLLIVLVIGAGTDYGLFLSFRTREELRAGLQPKEAAVRALTRVGESITFSAGTVIAALLSLLAATFQLYSQLAVPLAIGIAVMLAAGLTLLPALLALFGDAAFWPSAIDKTSSRDGLWSRISDRIVRHPVATLGAGVVVFGVLAIASAGYAPGGYGSSVTAPAGSDSAAGNALEARYFPQATTTSTPTDIVLALRAPAWQQGSQLTAVTQQLAKSKLFTGVTGPLDPAGVPLTPAQYAALHAQLGPAAALPATPPLGTSVSPALYERYRATAGYTSPDGRVVEFTVNLSAGDPTTTAALDAVPAVRAEAASAGRAAGATAWGVNGRVAALYDVSATSSSDLGRVIPIAILVIGLLLALVMRSLVAPLYLIASVALSYFAALGVTVLAFLKIGGEAGISFILPFLMFVFLLALGEDYNILVMSRIREESHHVPIREAVHRALRATSTTITSAGLILAGTFGFYALLGSRGPNGSTATVVGAGVAIGILMDTFLVRTLLVPSAVVLLGRWNWWPSRLRKVQPPSSSPALAPAGKQAGQPAKTGAEG